MPIVTVDSVHKRYRLGDQIVAALRGASLMVEEGEFLVLSGPSGSGKSTLLNIIGCIDTADSGEVIITYTFSMLYMIFLFFSQI